MDGIAAPRDASPPESPILAQSPPASPVLDPLPLLPLDNEKTDRGPRLRSWPSSPAAADASAGGADAGPALADAEAAGRDGAVLSDSSEGLGLPPGFGEGLSPSDSASEISPFPPGCVGQLGWEVGLQTLLAEYSVAGVGELPPECFSKFHADGFSWLSLPDLPPDADLAELNAVAERQGVRVFVRGSDMQRFFAGSNQFRVLLGRGDPAVFPAEFAASLLTLPGLRVLCSDTPHCDAYRRLLSRNALQWGTFSVLEVACESGEMVAWKYAGDESRILVCANCSTNQARAHISCPDAPALAEGDAIRVYMWLADTFILCTVQDLRAQGLPVCLKPFEAQIFEY
jgi:hypothetical protein